MSYTQERRYEIPGGDAGIEATVQLMGDVTRAALPSPLLGAAAADIVARAGPGRSDRARELRRWLAENTRFEFDPRGVEWIRTPRNMLDEIRNRNAARGDCDDVAVLGAALAFRMGLEPRFRLVGFDRGPWSHVFTEVRTPGGWTDLDVTRPAQLPEGLEVVRDTTREV